MTSAFLLEQGLVHLHLLWYAARIKCLILIFAFCLSPPLVLVRLYLLFYLHCGYFCMHLCSIYLYIGFVALPAAVRLVVALGIILMIFKTMGPDVRSEVFLIWRGGCLRIEPSGTSMCRALGDEEKLEKVPEKASEREVVSQRPSKEGLSRTK